MRSIKLWLFIFSCGLVLHSCKFSHFLETPFERVSTSRDANVCGHLKDSVILYAIFVDVAAYHPFTEYDIRSTMDSIHKATRWIENQADSNNVPLSIKPIRHEVGKKWTFDENRTLVRPNMHPFVKPHQKRKYVKYTNQWADYISRYAGRGVVQKRSTKTNSKTKIFDTETLIASLRNKYATDNIALMFFVNGYYEHETCMAFNIYCNGPAVEYSVVTHKSPATIAHEFLHLFGAIDLYPNQNHPNFNYRDLEAKYPNEIMRQAHKNINKLKISPISKYYLGWTNNIPNSDLRLLYHHANVVDY